MLVKVMLKILQARLQQYVNHEFPDVQAGFRKGRGTRDQIANIRWIMDKSREFQKNIYFCFIDYAKAFDCVDHKKLWKILEEIGMGGQNILLAIQGRMKVRKAQAAHHRDDLGSLPNYFQFNPLQAPPGLLTDTPFPLLFL